jgi:energy-coupling factor transport system ATP-binding protein
LALAGVLALRPGLLLLDEPSAMLDPDGAAALREQVLAVLAATGATCLLVEHRVAPWVEVVDRVVVLAAGGGVVADGPAAEVLGRRGPELAADGVWVPGHLPSAAWSARSRRSLTPGELLLTADGVAVRRPGLAAPAVRHLDLDLHAGRATCVAGPNGSGKSSLALALAGLVAPSAGEIRASAELTAGARSPHPASWRPRELVTRIGTVFQEPQHQFLASTCAEELAIGPKRTGVPAAETGRRVSELLDRLRLAPLARANPFSLSGGEQRRLSVATVLATRPRVLVLDEPTFGQDARTWGELVTLLGELLAEGTAVLAVTHDDDLVTALADDVLRLRGGLPDPGLPARGTAR